MITNSDDERLKQIRERARRVEPIELDFATEDVGRKCVGYVYVRGSSERVAQMADLYDTARGNLFANAKSDIDFLLSLLDSQTDEKFVGPCAGCGHNNYDAERKECKQRWMEGRYSVVCGCPCAKHNSLSNAATRMRDKCAAILKRWCKCGPRIHCSFCNVRKEVESLTLDQVEQKQ